jgi:hypothetical protein
MERITNKPMTKKTQVGKVKTPFSEKLMTCGLNKIIKAVSLMKFGVIVYRWPKAMAIPKFHPLCDNAIILDLGILKSTFSGRARVSRPNERQVYKPSMMSRLKPGIASQSWFSLARIHLVETNSAESPFGGGFCSKLRAIGARPSPPFLCGAKKIGARAPK